MGAKTPGVILKMTDLRFPIGEFTIPTSVTTLARGTAIASIKNCPRALAGALAGLSDEQLDTPYRPDGWTVRQVTHHVPESHMNAYVRMKIALTEDDPVIRTYEEARWAELPDVKAPVELSVTLLSAIVARWVILCELLNEKQWHARFRHPDLGVMNVEQLITMYAWHGEHHVAHIMALRKRMGW